MNVVPVNGHVLIEPLKQESFVVKDRDTYEEVGLVIAKASDVPEFKDPPSGKFTVKVFFDSWLAARYPTGNGEEYFWLVPWADVRAIEYESLPE